MHRGDSLKEIIGPSAAATPAAILLYAQRGFSVTMVTESQIDIPILFERIKIVHQ